MDWDYVFSRERWRQRFRSEAAVRRAAEDEGRAPDASVDEVGVPKPNRGFDGQPLRGQRGSGHGTGDPGGPGWAGWGG